jgi:DNA-binding protein H-NS
MASYKELTAQLDKLTKQAELARVKEMQTVIGQIDNIMAEYGITGADLGLKTTRGRRKSSGAVPKY